jgi:trigger factor
MKVQVEDVSPIEKRLSIEVEPQVVEQELKAAYTALSMQVKVPGFRPGKIPRRILEQRYGREVEADVVRRVQINAFVDAVKTHTVPAVSDPSFSGGTLAPNAPFAFTARVEVKPKVEAKDYKGVTLKKFDASVADAAVEEQVEKLRQSRAEVAEVTDRTAAKAGDMVTIDFDATKGGAAFPGNTGRDVTVEVAPGELVDGNLPQLDGVAVGGKCEFDYTFPADYRVDEVKGQAAHFVVTVKGLKAKVVPALDDAFAGKLGVATVADLKARVRTDLERAAKNRTATDEREGVLKALIEKNTFDVPQAMVERGVDMLLENALGSLARSGVDPRMFNLDWSSLRKDLRPRAETEVRGQMILEAIGGQEKFEVTDADVEAKLALVAEEAGAPLAAVKKQYQTADAKESIKHRVLEDKAIEFVKQHAKFES